MKPIISFDGEKSHIVSPSKAGHKDQRNIHIQHLYVVTT